MVYELHLALLSSVKPSFKFCSKKFSGMTLCTFSLSGPASIDIASVIFISYTYLNFKSKKKGLRCYNWQVVHFINGSFLATPKWTIALWSHYFKMNIDNHLYKSMNIYYYMEWSCLCNFIKFDSTWRSFWSVPFMNIFTILSLRKAAQTGSTLVSFCSLNVPCWLVLLRTWGFTNNVLILSKAFWCKWAYKNFILFLCTAQFGIRCL